MGCCLVGPGLLSFPFNEANNSTLSGLITSKFASSSPVLGGVGRRGLKGRQRASIPRSLPTFQAGDSLGDSWALPVAVSALLRLRPSNTPTRPWWAGSAGDLIFWEMTFHPPGLRVCPAARWKSLRSESPSFMSKVPTRLALGKPYDLGCGGRALVWMGVSGGKKPNDPGEVNRSAGCCCQAAWRWTTLTPGRQGHPRSRYLAMKKPRRAVVARRGEEVSRFASRVFTPSISDGGVRPDPTGRGR